MSKQIEFYFDFSSPNTYIAVTQLPQLAQKYGAEIVYKPALLGGIFKETSNRPPVSVPAKGRWMLTDLHRFAQRYNIPFKMNPHFIVNTVRPMRGMLVAMRDGHFQPYYDAMWQAMWVDGKDISDPEVMAEVVSTAGLDPNPILEGTQDPAIKQELIERTAEAVERGLFGMPTIFVDGEMHYGKDRLDFVEEALAGED